MPIADRNTYLEPLSIEFRKQWPENWLHHIVCHGHSVPAGYFATPLVDTFHAYPHLLHRMLKGRLNSCSCSFFGGAAADLPNKSLRPAGC